MDSRQEIITILLGQQKEKVHYYLVMIKFKKKVLEWNEESDFKYFNTPFIGSNLLVPFSGIRNMYMCHIYTWCKEFVKKYESEYQKQQNKSPFSKEMIEVLSIRKEIVVYQDLSKRFVMEDVYYHSINSRKTRIKQLLKTHFEKQ
jgi:hypothetical protein